MLLFFISLLFVAVLSQCPMDCSGHGSCRSDGKCTCSAGYAGADCSIALTALTSGVSRSGYVQANQWKFYSILNPSQGPIYCDLSPADSGSDSDCDLYAKFGDLPSSSRYDMRDVEWGTTAHVGNPNAQAGTWYFGVYGSIFNCAFNIIARTEGCSAGCVHGHCQNTTCICDPGYIGTSCETQNQDESISLNTIVTSSVAKGAWKYYTVQLPQNYPQVLVIVNVTNVPPAGHDCDVYIRKFLRPDHSHSDYKDVSPDANVAINIPNATAGKWYIGFWGYQQCNFHMKVQTTSAQCISDCSLHGTCGPPCHCRVPYAGTACETRTTPLQNGEVDTGFTAQNTWNYFKYVSDSTENVKITVTETTNDGDCDLYVRHNAQPSRLVYDYLSIGNEKEFTITVTDALQDTLFIGVFGWSKCTYRIKVVQDTQCPANCNRQGSCVNGKCVCSQGYLGADCSARVTPIRKAQVVSGYISTANEWNYYNFTGLHSTLVLALQEDFVEANHGFLGIFFAEDSQPTFRENIKANIDETNQYKSIEYATLNTAHSHNWIIGIYGSPLMASRVSRPLHYKLLAWEPDF